MPAVAKAHADWSTKVKTSRPQRLAAAGGRAPSAADGGRPADRSRSTSPRPRRGRRPSCCSPAAPAAMPDSYRRYLINSIRQSFDLPGTPMRLTVKAGANPYATTAEARRRAATRRPPGRGATKAARSKAQGQAGQRQAGQAEARQVAGLSRSRGAPGLPLGKQHRRVGRPRSAAAASSTIIGPISAGSGQGVGVLAGKGLGAHAGAHRRRGPAARRARRCARSRRPSSAPAPPARPWWPRRRPRTPAAGPRAPEVRKMRAAGLGCAQQRLQSSGSAGRSR